MFDSILNTFKDRINSPLYGAFIFSWVTINWKIFYITIFVEADRLGSGRIFFIEQELAKLENSILFPLLSTVFILLIMPYIRLYAYQLQEWFKDKRDIYDRTRSDKKWIRPEIAKSLRDKIRTQDDEFEMALTKKDEQLFKLQKEVDDIDASRTEKEIIVNNLLLEKEDLLKLQSETKIKIDQEQNIFKDQKLKLQQKIESLEKIEKASSILQESFEKEIKVLRKQIETSDKLLENALEKIENLNEKSKLNDNSIKGNQSLNKTSPSDSKMLGNNDWRRDYESLKNENSLHKLHKVHKKKNSKNSIFVLEHNSSNLLKFVRENKLGAIKYISGLGRKIEFEIKLNIKGNQFLEWLKLETRPS